MKQTSPANATNVGAVLIFKEGVSKEEAEVALKKIQELLEHNDVREFNAEWGSPVWYIP